MPIPVPISLPVPDIFSGIEQFGFGKGQGTGGPFQYKNPWKKDPKPDHTSAPQDQPSYDFDFDNNFDFDDANNDRDQPQPQPPNPPWVPALTAWSLPSWALPPGSLAVPTPRRRHHRPGHDWLVYNPDPSAWFADFDPRKKHAKKKKQNGKGKTKRRSNPIAEFFRL
jgi:hypothetical protein